MNNLPRPTISAWFPAVLLLLLSSACAPPVKTAAWVVRFDLDTPEEAARVCREAKAAGFDHLIAQVRGRADAHYQSALAPAAENLSPPGFDSLAALLADCAPMPVHAWLNVFYLWGGKNQPDNPRHPGHPEMPWILSDNQGKPVSLYSARERRMGWIEGTYADPASPEYRQLFYEVVRELLARYPVAGIHLDFIRYPGPGYGKSEARAREFAALFGLDPRLLPEKLAPELIHDWLTGGLSPADRVLTTAALFWNEFRAGQVSALVSEVRRAIRESGARHAKLSAAVFPDPAEAYLDNGQEWQAWAAAGLVDALYPMAYFGDITRVSAQLARIAATTPAQREVALWAGLGPEGKSPAAIAAEAKKAGELGFAGISLFSLGHLLKNPPPSIWVKAAASGHFHSQTEASPEKHTPQPAQALIPARSRANLKNIVVKALPGFPLPEGLEERLAARLGEYEEAKERSIPEALSLLAAAPVSLPDQAVLSGIFRFVHPLDSLEKGEEQQGVCDKARQRLLAGEEPARVARELSQDPSRSLDGLLPSRFLDPLEARDRELAALPPGGVSGLIASPNGCWCYRLEKMIKKQKTPFSDAPWEARRILLRGKLTELFKGTGKLPGKAEP